MLLFDFLATLLDRMRVLRSLDPDSITLIFELNLTFLKLYLRTKMNFVDQGFQKLKHYKQTDRQTDRQTDKQMRPNVSPQLQCG